jgi:hypothetical protein
MGDIGPIRRIVEYPDLEPIAVPTQVPEQPPVPIEPEPVEPEKVPA